MREDLIGSFHWFSYVLHYKEPVEMMVNISRKNDDVSLKYIKNECFFKISRKQYIFLQVQSLLLQLVNLLLH